MFVRFRGVTTFRSNLARDPLILYCIAIKVDTLNKGLSSDRRPVLDLLAVEGWRALLGIIDGQVWNMERVLDHTYSIFLSPYLFGTLVTHKHSETHREQPFRSS